MIERLSFRYFAPETGSGAPVAGDADYDEGPGPEGSGTDSPDNIADTLDFRTATNEEVLRYNPFPLDGISDEEDTSEGEGDDFGHAPQRTEQPAPQPDEVSTSGDGSQPGQPPQPQIVGGQQQPGQQDELTVLRQQVAQLQGALQAVQYMGGQQRPPQQEAGQQRPQQQPPQYRYSLPREALQALRSENDAEFSEGIALVLQSVAQNVHENLRKEFNETLSSQVPHMIRSYTDQTTQMTGIASDFYGTFPELNTPELRGLVRQTAQEFQNAGWANYDANFRNALGMRVRQKLASYGQMYMQPAPQQQPQQAPAKPNRMAGTGTRARPMRNGMDENSPDAIADVLGL